MTQQESHKIAVMNHISNKALYRTILSHFFLVADQSSTALMDGNLKHHTHKYNYNPVCFMSSDSNSNVRSYPTAAKTHHIDLPLPHWAVVAHFTVKWSVVCSQKNSKKWHAIITYHSPFMLYCVQLERPILPNQNQWLVTSTCHSYGDRSGSGRWIQKICI